MKPIGALFLVLTVRSAQSQQETAGLPPLILPELPRPPAQDPRDAFIQAINNNVINPDPSSATSQPFGNFDREPQFSPPTEPPNTTPSNRFPVQVVICYFLVICYRTLPVSSILLSVVKCYL